MFSQRFCPTTGKMECVMEEEGYDLRNEVARASYADMLHDSERNKKYYEATKVAVHEMRKTREEICMLDIGTGTGLLAMMSVRSGADRAVACEAFKPIATAAQKIIEHNGLADKITVVGKCSTELTVGKDGDLPTKANLLVTELWDTELIGEGALPTLRDASQRLLEPGFVSVPAAATINIQAFSSKALWDMHQLNADMFSESYGLKFPRKMANCAGTASAFDFHVNQIPDSEIQLLSDETPVLRFEFCRSSIASKCPNIYCIPEARNESGSDTKVVQYEVSTTVQQSGVAHGFVMWWVLDMDIHGEITLSTAPRWAHPDGNSAQWRDHWMQAVFYLKTPLDLKRGEEVTFLCCHDDYSLWFDLKLANHIRESSKETQLVVDRPFCTCGAHVAWSRPRFCMLNDSNRMQMFQKALKQTVAGGSSRCLCVGDGSLLPLLAAKAGFSKVVSLEPSFGCKRIIEELVELNGLHKQIEIWNKQVDDVEQLPDGPVDVILGEPFFSPSLFPWHHLYFWYAAANAARLASPAVKVLPQGATLKALAVECKDMWKFHALVGAVEGFDVTVFDDLIKSSKMANESRNSESSNGIALEPHHVWEYPCKLLSPVADILSFDFNQAIPSERMRAHGQMSLTRSGTCHCVVLWMDFHLSEDMTLTTGLQESEVSEEPPKWVRHTKQGVYFMRSPITIDDLSLSHSPKLKYSVAFKPSAGEISFDFHVLQNGV